MLCLQLTRDIQKNLTAVLDKLGGTTSFDVIVREFDVAGRRAALIFLDGMGKSWEVQMLIRQLMAIERGELGPKPVEKLLRRFVDWMEVETVDDVDKAVAWVLAGPSVLLVDGVGQALALDMRELPARSPEEPDLERVTRGSRDGFVETLVFNTALIRRRLRDPRLRFEMVTAGQNASTDVAVAYLAGEADMAVVEDVKRKIADSRIVALTMGARSLADFIAPQGLNPLPRVRMTERPDVVAAHLLEGHVAVLVDTTPQAILLPVTMWHFTQHAEEFFHQSLTGTYFRWIRFAGIIVSLCLGPLWLALATTDEAMLPPWLAMIGPKEAPSIPLWLQLFILEIGLDILRVALVHTPTALATSLGIVGAILLGDLAVEVGIFVPETILYTALVVIGQSAHPNMEFAYAFRLFRYVILAAVALFRLPGFVGGLVFVLLVMAGPRSFGVPYLWPLIPFDGKALLTLLFRYPLPSMQRWVSRRGPGLPDPEPEPTPGSP